MSFIDQLLSTRIFLFLFSITLITVIIFTAFSTQTQSVTIYSPSESVFKQLSLHHSNTLSCPCSQTLIRHDKFLIFNPHYHSICTSQFVNQSFLSSLFDVNISSYYSNDYRLMAAAHFQMLALFCRTIQQMIVDSLNQFYSQHLNTLEVISDDMFNAQIDHLIDQLKTANIANMKHTSQWNLF
ncbi:hypothetical protein I4U23_015572 [Adineta vaga]|nr:hypothetical protein I4U23_015572 [Adineta vaga]